jgi:hypothetical protein
MRRKGLFTLSAAVFMVLAFSAMTFAANQVVMKTTVPNIPKSSCYQAGTDTMEFDTATVIREGDVIEFTLNNKVTVCQAINMFLTLAPGATGLLDTTGVQPVSDPGGGAISAATVAGDQWGFLVQATTNSQIIRLTLRQITTATGVLVALDTTHTMTYTAVVSTDKMIVKLFDGKTGVWAASGFQKYTSANTYNTAITEADNVLCIDTLSEDYMGEYVQNTPNSLPGNVADKLNFSGDYIIAHIMTPQTQSIISCGGKTGVGHIRIGEQGVQAADTCTSFDFETAGGPAVTDGYCTDHKAGNKLIIETSGSFDVGNYVVKAQIVVERGGAAKATPGVYWSNDPLAPTGGGYTSLANACLGAAQGAPLVPTWLRKDGTTAASARAPAGASCDLTAGEKAVYLTTPASDLSIASGDSYIWLDLPQFNYDPAEIAAGDVVKVKVTLTRGCAAIGPLTITVGTFGCALAPTTGALLFPYFTSLDANDFWNGIAIVNTGSTAGTATLTAYEKDGSVGQAVVDVPAKGMYVNLLELMTWTGTGLGGSQCYIQVDTTGIASADLDGLGMIAKSTGESMGYLPRK